MKIQINELFKLESFFNSGSSFVDKVLVYCKKKSIDLHYKNNYKPNSTEWLKCEEERAVIMALPIYNIEISNNTVDINKVNYYIGVYKTQVSAWNDDIEDYSLCELSFNFLIKNPYHAYTTEIFTMMSELMDDREIQKALIVSQKENAFNSIFNHIEKYTGIKSFIIKDRIVNCLDFNCDIRIYSNHLEFEKNDVIERLEINELKNISLIINNYELYDEHNKKIIYNNYSGYGDFYDFVKKYQSY